MTNLNQNVTIFASDSMDIHVTVSTDKGAVKDLTGATDIRYAIRANPDLSNPPLVLKTLEDGITIINPTKGKFVVALSPSDTADLKGNYYHVCRVTDAEGRICTVFVGTISIREAGFA